MVQSKSTMAVMMLASGVLGWLGHSQLVSEERVPPLLAITECANAYASVQDVENPNEYYALEDKDGEPAVNTFIVEYVGNDGVDMVHVAFPAAEYRVGFTPTDIKWEWGSTAKVWDQWFSVDPVNHYAVDDSSYTMQQNAVGDTTLIVRSVKTDDVTLASCYTVPTLPPGILPPEVPPVDPPQECVMELGFGVDQGSNTWILKGPSGGDYGTGGFVWLSDDECLDIGDVLLAEQSWTSQQVIVMKPVAWPATEQWLIVQTVDGVFGKGLRP